MPENNYPVLYGTQRNQLENVELQQFYRMVIILSSRELIQESVGYFTKDQQAMYYINNNPVFGGIHLPEEQMTVFFGYNETAHRFENYLLEDLVDIEAMDQRIRCEAVVLPMNQQINEPYLKPMTQHSLNAIRINMIDSGIMTEHGRLGDLINRVQQKQIENIELN